MHEDNILQESMGRWFLFHEQAYATCLVASDHICSEGTFFKQLPLLQLSYMPIRASSLTCQTAWMLALTLA